MPRRLIIPDVHQEIGWANAVLAREPAERPEHVVFLGDFFDKSSFTRRPASMDETCVAVKGWAQAGHILLPGNHDAQYLEAAIHPEGRRMRIGQNLDSEAFSRRFPTRDALAAVFPRLHTSLPLHTDARTVLLTHAGLDEAHVPNGYTEADLDRLLDDAWRHTTESDWREIHPLVCATGRCRDGRASYTATGGVLWRDHVEEPSHLFVDQICGHTAGHDAVDIQCVLGPDGKVRHHICLDGRQSTYVRLDGDKFTVRACTPDGDDLLFRAQLPCGFLQYLRSLELDLITGEITAIAGRFDAAGKRLKVKI